MKAKEITIVDSVMGSGKTSWAINYINENQHENIMYITPFLDETQRIKEACPAPREFQLPKNKGNGKLDNLNDLLMSQEDIASTHELFKRLNDDSKEYIREGHYTLILDEVLNVVDPYNIKKMDLKTLTESKCITIDEAGFVHWNWDNNLTESDTSFSEVMMMAESRSLICVNGVLLLWRYPPEIFGLFDKVYILTYLFEASVLKNYFDMYHMKYVKKSVRSVEGKYCLCDYYEPDTRQFKRLVNVFNGDLNNNIRQKNNGLSSTWFDSGNNEKWVSQIKNNIYNYFHNNIKAKADSVMWTTFKKCFNKLKGKGYTNGFVACNCRSTNEYADRYNLVYALNTYVHPSVTQFFVQKGITIDQDLYALSEMLQWIWRSRIRSGESINIYVPSDRMRGLLIRWLNGEIAP